MVHADVAGCPLSSPASGAIKSFSKLPKPTLQVTHPVTLKQQVTGRLDKRKRIAKLPQKSKIQFIRGAKHV
jgi:hypothetical protein